MILAIFGYPKTGKTLLFNLLTSQKQQTSKFSSGPTKLHQAVVNVRDDRLKKLAEIYQTKPVHAKIEFLDTGPLAYGDAKSSTFLNVLRRADGLVHVVRAFQDPEILHPRGSVDPHRDIEQMKTELQINDLVTIEKRQERLHADMKKKKTPEMEKELELLQKLQRHIEGGRTLKDGDWSVEERKQTRGFSFLSLKPLITVINGDESAYPILREKAGSRDDVYPCSLKIEKELLEFDSGERSMFEEEFGLQDYRYLNRRFIPQCYRSLGLVSFFTVGHDEVKAWTINRGESAFIAAGKIHSDIQEGFIRAEVLKLNDLLRCGGFSKARREGKVQLEGKEYIVRDGDIIHFRFNR